MLTFIKFIILTLAIITVAGSFLIGAQGAPLLGAATGISVVIVTLCGLMIADHNS